MVDPAHNSMILPAGSPAWITADLVDYTIRVWQPFYKQPVTVDEAIAIIEGAGRLLRILAREDRVEGVADGQRYGKLDE
jgi:hypothetical protein